MRLKVDENLPIEVAEVLRQPGHDAMTVLEQQRGGSPDAGLVALCQQEGRALVTLDFGPALDGHTSAGTSGAGGHGRSQYR